MSNTETFEVTDLQSVPVLNIVFVSSLFTSLSIHDLAANLSSYLMFLIPSIQYQDLAFNFTYLRQQIVSTGHAVTHNLAPYGAQIKQFLDEYAVPLFQFNADSQTFGLLAAIAVGLILAATSRRLASRRNRHQGDKNAVLEETKPSVCSDSDILKTLCNEICHLPAVKHDRKLSSILTQAILSFKSARNEPEMEARKEQFGKISERHEKMEYVITQSVKEIEFLNSEVARLMSDLESLEALRDENTKLRRKCNQLLGEVAELRKKLATASQIVSNEDEIRDLEFQLLYGNTEKDKLIASLQKELSEKDKILRDGAVRSGSSAEESINKWLFEDCDTEYAL